MVKQDNATTEKVDAKKSGTTTDKPATEAKPKRQQRSLAERIAELQEKEKAQAAKKKEKAQGEFDMLVVKLQNSADQTAKLGEKVLALHQEHGFELPPRISELVGLAEVVADDEVESAGTPDAERQVS